MNDALPWWQRMLIGIASCIVVAVGFIGIMYLLGSAVDTFAQHRIEHDRCLKQATNGLEIERCR